MVKIQQKLKYGRSFGIEFGDVDIVKFAEAFGATGLQINKADEIAPILSKALNLTGPVIIDVPIDYRDNHSLCATVSEGLGH